jgi:hypothetical protein
MRELTSHLKQNGVSPIEPKLRAADTDLDVLPNLKEYLLAEFGLTFGDCRRF